MKVHPFIFNWRGQFEKACRTEAQLLEFCSHVTVINSDEEHTRPGWIDLGDSAYFMAQFTRAVAEFDGDVMFHVQADATYYDWHAVFDASYRAFKRYRWGIYAPNVDHTFYTPQHTEITSIKLDDANLRMVGCTDCTCWFLHRDVLQMFKDLPGNPAANHLGWGLDSLLAAYAIAAGRPVLRDYAHTVSHPPGTGYNKDDAMKLMLEQWHAQPPAIKQILGLSRDDANRGHLSRYFAPAAAKP